MANITRIDPFDDLFRGFFVRPMDFNGAPAQTPSIKMDVQEQGDKIGRASCRERVSSPV